MGEFILICLSKSILITLAAGSVVAAFNQFKNL